MNQTPDPVRAPVDEQSAAENLLKRLSRFIAWFSGSVAGVSAIIYAIGFVAYKAADKALGIGVDLASRDNFLIVIRGVSVLARTAIIAVWAVFLVLAVAAILRFAARRLRLGQRRSIAPLMRWLDAVAAPAAALAMLAVAGFGLARYSTPALDMEGLLFLSGQSPVECPADPLRRAMISQDDETLNATFAAYAISVGINFGILLLAWRRLTAAGQGLWMMLAGMGAFLSMLGAPIAYGALVADRTAPEVQIGPPPDDDPGAMRLLSRDRDGILVWLEQKGQIRWISAGQFKTLTIGREKTIMQTCRETPSPDQGAER